MAEDYCSIHLSSRMLKLFLIKFWETSHRHIDFPKHLIPTESSLAKWCSQYKNLAASQKTFTHKKNSHTPYITEGIAKVVP